MDTSSAPASSVGSGSTVGSSMPGPAEALPGAEAVQVRFPGLLSDEARMAAVVAALSREYEATFARQGELDEREFLDMDFNNMPSPK